MKLSGLNLGKSNGPTGGGNSQVINLSNGMGQLNLGNPVGSQQINRALPINLSILPNNPNLTAPVPTGQPGVGIIDLNAAATGEEVSYHRMELSKHIKERPDTYIGPRYCPNLRKIRIYDHTTGKYCCVDSRIPKGLVNIIREVMDNAFDNRYRSFVDKIPMDPVQVVFNGTSIKVINTGKAIPLYLDPKENMWTPQIIFGVLLTSSTYSNKDGSKKTGNLTGGKNGFGAKLTNLFSDWFKVTIVDPSRKLMYTQIWQDQMEQVGEPQIVPSDHPNTHIEIEFMPRLSYFGLEQYPPEMLGIILRLVADATFGAKFPAIVESQFFPSGSIELNLSKHINWLKAMNLYYIDRSTNVDTVDVTVNPITGPIVPLEQPKVESKGIAINLGLSPPSPLQPVDQPVQSNQINTLVDFNANDSKEVRKMIYHCEWPVGTPLNDKGKPVDPNAVPAVEFIVLDTPHVNASQYYPTLQEGVPLAWTNGIHNPDGGAHLNTYVPHLVDACVLLSNGIKLTSKEDKEEPIKGKKKPKNKSYMKDLKKTKITKEAAASKYQINKNDVLNHVTCIIVCWLPDPAFGGQTKSYLESPNPPCNPQEIPFAKLSKWNLAHELLSELNRKRTIAIAMSDKKGRSSINVKKLKDAINIGKKDEMCTLHITEGDSAAGWVLKALSRGITIGNFTMNLSNSGILPVRGKIMNVSGADAIRVAHNKEVTSIKKSVGLTEGIDYSNPVQFKTLRYKRIMVMTDPDDDGHHIKGLIINLFREKWPQLLNIPGFISFIRIPVIRLTKGKNVIRFYSIESYRNWVIQEERAGRQPKSWHHAYIKGLGTLSEKVMVTDLPHNNLVSFVSDPDTFNWLELAFGKKNARQRKAWIEGFNFNPIALEHLQLSYSTFIQNELVQFAIADNIRSIPGWDGLKPSQRKVVESCMKIFGYGRSKGADNMRVSSLAAHVCNKMGHHHGETSVEQAIISMAQSFVGGNNLPYLDEDGNFGSYFYGGIDAAAPRYPNTGPTWWWKLVFNPKDKIILKFKDDDGKKVEPETYYPLLPMMMVNGAIGIGFGHSTFIPQYNPLDLVYWYMIRITRDINTGFDIKLKYDTNETGMPLLYPWYRGFEGDIRIVSHDIDTPQKDDKNKDEDEDEEVGETVDGDNAQDAQEAQQYREAMTNKVMILPDTRLSMVSSGVLEKNKDGSVLIKSLPLGRWPAQYIEWLKDQQTEGKITSFVDHSTDKMCKILVHGATNPNLKSMKLRRCFGLSNMVIMNEEHRPIKFDGSHELLENYYYWRLAAYEVRKQAMLTEMIEKDRILSMKALLIQAILDGKVIYHNQRKKDIYAQVETLGFDKSLMDSISLMGLSAEEIEKINNDRVDLQREYNTLYQTSHHMIWYQELANFLEAYMKHYVMDKPFIGHNGIRFSRTVKAVKDFVTPSTRPTPVNSGVVINLGPIRNGQ